MECMTFAKDELVVIKTALDDYANILKILNKDGVSGWTNEGISELNRISEKVALALNNDN